MTNQGFKKITGVVSASLPNAPSYSLMSPKVAQRRFPFERKTGGSALRDEIKQWPAAKETSEKSNGTDFFTGNFSEKYEYLLR